MKAIPAVLLLSGVTAALAGALTRSCDQDVASQIAHAWCGPALQTMSVAHEHCAGCVLLVAGLTLITVSLAIVAWKRPAAARAKART